jgi:ATP-binding protein involved in chromosome partitioning
MPLSADSIRDELRAVKYPGFSRDIVSFGLIQDIHLHADAIHVVLEHSIEDAGVLERIRRDAQAVLDRLAPGNAQLEIRRKGGATAQPAQQGRPGPGSQQMLPQRPSGIAHIVAVASAKGGVGKSTAATNLALALARSGKRVGLLDADVYGPSLPTMMGVGEKPVITEDRKMIPIERDGIKMISIGFLVPKEKAMIWRGPMVMGAVQQFLADTVWGELDVLVVDLPPGTGDAQLTLVQQVPISGVVMVTTPQEVALIDVVRGIQMFEETNAPIIGVLENMSGFVCPSCGHEEDIFGKGGGKRTSERYGVPYLGSIPLDPAIRKSGDDGKPIVAAHPESAAARAFAEVADSVVRFLQAKAARGAS